MTRMLGLNGGDCQNRESKYKSKTTFHTGDDNKPAEANSWRDPVHPTDMGPSLVHIASDPSENAGGCTTCSSGCKQISFYSFRFTGLLSTVPPSIQYTPQADLR